MSNRSRINIIKKSKPKNKNLPRQPLWKKLGSVVEPLAISPKLFTPNAKKSNILPLRVENSLVPQDLPSPASQDLPSSASQDLPSPVLQNLPFSASQDLPSPASQDLPSPASQDLPSPVLQDLPSPVSQDLPSSASQDLPSPASQDLPSSASQDLPSSASQDLPFIAESSLAPLDLPSPDISLLDSPNISSLDASSECIRFAPINLSHDAFEKLVPIYVSLEVVFPSSNSLSFAPLCLSFSPRLQNESIEDHKKADDAEEAGEIEHNVGYWYDSEMPHLEYMEGYEEVCTGESNVEK